MSQINMQAAERVVVDMKNHRSELTRERIIEIITLCMASDQTRQYLWAETTQDVWWAYQRHLKRFA